jgi:hypothetical protein
MPALGTRGAGSAKAFGLTGATGYLLQQSLRLRKSVLGYLSKTPPVTGSQTTWTMSMWVKLGTISDSTSPALFSNFVASPTYTNEYFGVFYTDSLQIYGRNSSLTTILSLTTSQVLRDPSAWYHLVFVADTTQATTANRFKLYINGIQVTAFSSATYPAQNTALSWNQNRIQYIGIQYNNSGGNLANTQPFDGYLSEVNFIDGQALTANSFGEFNSYGVWSPKKYTGTYGTNGYYLPFSDKTSTTTLGYDFSGNNNNWTPTNISLTAGVTYDYMLDVPTLTSATQSNYATLQQTSAGANASISNGGLTYTFIGSANCVAQGTMGMSSGKWYCEVTANGTQVMVGISNGSVATLPYVGNNANSWSYWGNNGNRYNNNLSTAYGSTYTTGDVVGIAFDSDVGSLAFYKNNVSQGVAYTGLTAGPYFVAVGNGNAANCSINFGQRPFSYTPPAGYNSLNAYNLSAPTISAGNKYMDATTYTGNGTALTVTNAGTFRPDLVWYKGRAAAFNNQLFDSVRGVSKNLSSNLTDAEGAISGVTAFNANGFTLGSENGGNQNGNTYVGWQWQAGQGSTSTNTSGNITSTVSVNTTSGFSIGTYSGNDTAGATIGHGLGVAPSMIIVKSRTNVSDWAVWHQSLTSVTGTLYLDLIDSQSAYPNRFNSSGFTSSVWKTGSSGGAGSEVNGSGRNFVAYCWTAIPGFSAFGSYIGNGSADGPFVYLGFRPRFYMFKRTDANGNWGIFDTARGTYNINTPYLYPNRSDAEASSTILDFLSNGFKIRSASSADWNTAGGTYIYAAFAENPFKYALAR